MDVFVNGKSERLEPGVTVADFLNARKLAPIRVAVEIDGELVPRREFSAREIHEGEHVEVVTFVGGG